MAVSWWITWAGVGLREDNMGAEEGELLTEQPDI